MSALDFNQMIDDLNAGIEEMHATGEPLMAGDNKIIAFCHVLERSEQLLTGACLTSDEEQTDRWIGWARALAEEWSIHPQMRDTIKEAALENAERAYELNEQDEFDAEDIDPYEACWADE